jgi:ubiquinone/menaquinone biosynthesis C-methylase UbiE
VTTARTPAQGAQPAHPPAPAIPAITEDRARRYAQHVAPTFVTLVRRAVDLAEIQPGDSVLDLGTKTGIAAFLAAERAGREGSVIGLDPAGALLDVARERSAGVGVDYIRWQEGESSPLTYADESFDAVLCLHALLDVPNPTAVLEEVRRVLVEEGRFVATLWGPRANNEWMAVLEDALRRHASQPLLGSLALTQPGNLESLLQTAGFVEIETARVPDRMRLQGTSGLWEWARATSRWGHAIDTLPEDRLTRARDAVDRAFASHVRDGELALEREIVYARAVAPASV